MPGTASPRCWASGTGRAARIKSGDMLEVDGDAGTVRILSEDEAEALKN
jgi:hypothetical protein